VADAVPARAGEVAGGAEVAMTFDSMVQAGLPWQVRPLTQHLKAKTGEFIRVDYEITNASNRRVVGQAIPRYLPAAAGEYVKKLDCFCFRQQSFEPGQTKRFPVVFVIDPKMPRDIGTITLAYTIFDVPGQGGA
jgi:cytochrome c oxidase assembly protein subunit 11